MHPAPPPPPSTTSYGGAALRIAMRERGYLPNPSRVRTSRLAWACSVAGLLVGAGACAAILVANAAHAASGVAPVLAPAPLYVVLVAVAFGLAAIVAEWLPSLAGAAPPRVGSPRAAVVPVVPGPVIARCAACGSVFGDRGVRTGGVAGASGRWSPSVN
jgi:hypothetical protein